MKKNMNIQGMMCTHCEAHVKGALSSLDGVEDAAVSHESGCALLTLSKDVSDEILKKAVEDAGYSVLGIETLA